MVCLKRSLKLANAAQQQVCSGFLQRNNFRNSRSTQQQLCLLDLTCLAAST
jgi:hypothetical protein